MGEIMNKQAAFTLIELMITIAIVAILALIGIPNLQQFVRQQTLEARANDFLTNLYFARGEAIARNQSQGIVVMPMNRNGTHAPGNNWSGGWSVCSDDNNNGPSTTAAKYCENDLNSTPPKEELLRHAQFDDTTNIIPITSNTSTTGVTVSSIIYQANGALAGGQNIFFKICNSDVPNSGKLLTVRATGSVSIKDSSEVVLTSGQKLCQ
jgi:prepilin-type N-terminal cleavage/methylation domain-containing protein